MKSKVTSLHSTLIFLILFAANTPFFSQVLTNKNGIPILPDAKDWSLGIDATRLIEDVEFNFVSTSKALTAKYMVTANTAYRMSLRLGLNNYTTKVMVDDRVAASSSVIAYPSAVEMTENVWKRKATAIGLSFGIEKRRGASRLQGIYGVEGSFYIFSTNDDFTYGNALNASTTTPIIVEPEDAITSPYFGPANNIDSLPKIQGVTGSARIITRKNGFAYSIGARAFVGAEYFFLPKMSIGGEFGYSLSFATSGRSETEMESIGQSNVPGSGGPEVKRTTIDGGVDNKFGLDSDNANMLGGISASLRINLFF